jgi:metallo-beta-lactamase family protein
VIRQAVERKGTLLIPAFALERTQEILYELAGLVKEGSIPAIPIFLDSPLAIKATRVYHDYDRYLDDDALLLKKHGEQLFQFPALKVTESAQQSKVIKEVNGPKVIIAGSGMMEGGRILHHAKEFLPQASTMLLIVGYQAVGTLGRKLYDNQRRVRIMGSWVNVKAHIMAIGAYSAHADQAALIEWLTQNGKPPKRTFLVHGEAEGATALADLLAVKDYSVTIPKTNQSVEIE